MSSVERSWYRPFGWTLLLFPLAILFWFISVLRKSLYRFNWLKQSHFDVPVIVVGNISVGGNGKTPMVIWLCEYLMQQQKKVVVISRGYGAKSSHYPLNVTSDVIASQAGDEPVLIHQRTGVPVVVGPNRVDNIKFAIEHFQPDVIISDDGMQHYKMKRDVEICIVDATRRFGNGFLIPMGPLRELPRRLKTVDLVIENGGCAAMHYQLIATGLYCVKQQQPLNAPYPAGIAMSAIGNPQRFENSLTDFGVRIDQRVHFRDHHHFSAADFEHYSQNTIYMTEKDAVKCTSFAKPDWYYLKVDAQLNEQAKVALTSLLLKKGIIHGL
ncbi:tetraacyldisaccharide 4'-kinase [Pseudoalteromonas tunicata]|uniref:Tetraacyldisaccharide 4'-kinase n=1 Tax=Pseudoalteromonas tunicata D2 TaxID=87626 RepID=A4CCA0_9GAMM|nr:tetraacyldisaccharide 4'-kinase [Pseudoalteromonas tunicata]ATC94535.1 tetraacyldisaccharide 4'-kinase [Pseudoalteromonas tunicata]AXT30262.1 tetraacyldisaccharide 4'-kinase [Pseudoalteromonas tunicata]EAR27987.1 tetraacyldisaccharide 4' kinase (lipid A 4'kinase) [Pseudoalteromonas tunicata D2]